MSRDQNAGRIQAVRMDNSTFERVEEFKYLGTTLTNQNSIAEETHTYMNILVFRRNVLPSFSLLNGKSTMLYDATPRNTGMLRVIKG